MLTTRIFQNTSIISGWCIDNKLKKVASTLRRNIDKSFSNQNISLEGKLEIFPLVLGYEPSMNTNQGMVRVKIVYKKPVDLVKAYNELEEAKKNAGIEGCIPKERGELGYWNSLSLVAHIDRLKHFEGKWKLMQGREVDRYKKVTALISLTRYVKDKGQLSEQTRGFADSVHIVPADLVCYTPKMKPVLNTRPIVVFEKKFEEFNEEQINEFYNSINQFHEPVLVLDRKPHVIFPGKESYVYTEREIGKPEVLFSLTNEKPDTQIFVPTNIGGKQFVLEYRPIFNQASLSDGEKIRVQSFYG